MAFNHEYLVTAMANADVSQTDLAVVLGVSPQAVQSWCAGKTSPRKGKRERIAKALNINPASLSNEPFCNTRQAALEIQNKVNDVIIALAADRDINLAIRLCAEIMDDLEAEYL